MRTVGPDTAHTYLNPGAEMLSDFRHAFRSLIRSPGFSVVVVATLAVGIGVTTTIFSVVDALLLEPLPYPDADRVMTLWESNPSQGIPQDRVAAGTFVDWQERSRSFDALGAYQNEDYILTDLNEAERLTAARITPELFRVLGVQPVLGRGFADEEAQPGMHRVVILSHGLWQRRFGAARDIAGTAVTLDGEPYIVVGVMPSGFDFPPDQRVDVWTPLTINPQLLPIRAMRTYNVVGRLEAAIDVETARTELRAIAADIENEHPQSNRGWTVDITPVLDQVLGDAKLLVVVVAGAAGFVLLIGCANVANLLLARATAQEREYAIRSTLGASGALLIRRSFAESLLLAVGGGTTGVLVSLWGIALLRGVLPGDLPRVQDVGIDGSVLVFAVVISLAAGLLFGFMPALQSRNPRLAEILQNAARGSVGRRYAKRLLGGLVIAEVALALMLLVSATSLLRSFARLLDVDPGFRSEDVVSVALSLPETQYRTPEQQRQFYNALVDQVAALPGVINAGAVSALPMSALGIDFDLPFEIPDRPAPTPAERPRAEYRAVIPGYFRTLGISLIRGRLLDGFDRNEGRPVMVINETMERLYFPDVDPIGQSLGVPMAGSIEIVGIVGDVRHHNLGEAAQPEMFVSYQNFPLREMHIVARSLTVDPGSMLRGIRERVHALDPQLPVVGSATLAALLAESLAQPRFNTTLITVFSVCALILAAVGIYGVVSYSVAQRTSEIGMRIALGAGPRDTLELVLRQAVRFVVVGGTIGIAGQLAVGQVIRGMLFQVAPADPVTMVGVVVFLLVTAMVAAGAPALRATRIDPVAALRTE